MSLVMETLPLMLEALLEPVMAEQPAGLFNEEDETYQTIDQEMIKLGGLREGTLDWSYVDEASRQYLHAQCKHFRIAGHLMTTRLREKTWAAWIEAAGLLAGLVERYWETSYPKPGPTGYPAKRKQVSLLIHRLTTSLAELHSGSLTETHRQAAQRALDTLQHSAPKAALDMASLTRLEAQLSKLIEQAQRPKPEPVPVPKAPGQSGGQALSPEYFSARNDLQLGNERESRHTLLKVADFVSQQDAYDPVGYQLRRFALWSGILSVPAVKREQRTELMCVPLDIVQDYLESLASNRIDPPLLQRVEKSVVSSPFWIRGSWIAASIAARLEMSDAAAAIRHATVRFVRRLPTLHDLRFSDGTTFIDTDTHTWLSGADAHDAQAAATLEFADLRSELMTQLDTEGVEVVLRRLQDIQAEYSAPRQRCYATVMAADVLASRGLSWLANDLYASVRQTMQATTADQWEPDMHNHLVQRGQSAAAITHGSKV
jgi:type VI secretion system protein VasJ